jgi:hypothetical protein
MEEGTMKSTQPHTQLTKGSKEAEQLELEARRKVVNAEIKRADDAAAAQILRDDADHERRMRHDEENHKAELRALDADADKKEAEAKGFVESQELRKRQDLALEMLVIEVKEAVHTLSTFLEFSSERAIKASACGLFKAAGVQRGTPEALEQAAQRILATLGPVVEAPLVTKPQTPAPEVVRKIGFGVGKRAAS